MHKMCESWLTISTQLHYWGQMRVTHMLHTTAVQWMAEPTGESHQLSKEALPPSIGIPSLLGMTWEHEPHLAQEASSYANLNILIQVHSKSLYVATLYNCVLPAIPAASIAPCIHDQDGSTVSPATMMTSGHWCFCTPVHSASEVWMREIKEDRVTTTGLMVGQKGKLVLAASTSWTQRINVVLTEQHHRPH